MQLNVTGHHVEVTASLRAYVEKKFERIVRHFDQVIDVHCILTVEKLSGEMLYAEVTPVTTGMGVAVGRTFLDGHAIRRYDAATPDNAENTNFGNFVGLAFADGARLVIVDGDQRGMSPPDDTYFAVLIVE